MNSQSIKREVAKGFDGLKKLPEKIFGSIFKQPEYSEISHDAYVKEGAPAREAAAPDIFQAGSMTDIIENVSTNKPSGGENEAYPERVRETPADEEWFGLSDDETQLESGNNDYEAR